MVRIRAGEEMYKNRARIRHTVQESGCGLRLFPRIHLGEDVLCSTRTLLQAGRGED